MEEITAALLDKAHARLRSALRNQLRVLASPSRATVRYGELWAIRRDLEAMNYIQQEFTAETGAVSEKGYSCNEG